MGVKTQSDCPGDAPLEMQCAECDDTFWTDETMLNDCPDCGFQSMTPA